MIPDAIEHAAPMRNAMPVNTPMGRPASFGTSATSAVSTMPMTMPMTTAPTSGEDPDGRVLAADEGGRALVDGARDVLHRYRARVPGEDISGEVDGEQDGDEPCRQDYQLKRAGVHQDRRSSTLG